MAGKRLLFSHLCLFWGILFYSVLVNGEFANQWAVYMHGGMEVATRVALEHGFRNMGPVSIGTVFIFIFSESVMLLAYRLDFELHSIDSLSHL